MAKKQAPYFTLAPTQKPKVEPPPAQLQLFSKMHFAAIDPKIEQLADEVAPRLNRTTSMTYYAVLHPETVFERLDDIQPDTAQYEKWSLCGVTAQVTPKRIRSFRGNLKCVCCGREGNMFLVERHKNDIGGCQYLNLYHASQSGLALMTVDHILPDSLGGKYSQDNFQTMCRSCNSAKGNLMSIPEIEKVRANIALYAKSWVVHEFLDLLLSLQLHINKAEENTKEQSDLRKIFDQYRRRIKYNTKPGAANAAVLELRQAIDRHFSPRPVIAAHVVKPHSWLHEIKLAYRRWRKQSKKLVAQSIRRMGVSLVNMSNAMLSDK